MHQTDWAADVERECGYAGGTGERQPPLSHSPTCKQTFQGSTRSMNKNIQLNINLMAGNECGQILSSLIPHSIFQVSKFMSWLRMSKDRYSHSILMFYSSPPTHSLEIQNHCTIPPSLLPRNYRTLNSYYGLDFVPHPPKHVLKSWHPVPQDDFIWKQGHCRCN